ncbi:nitrogen fixation protein NifH [Acidobacteriota bacterium]
MDSWKDVLKTDLTSWLLEKENPSVRYFTLVDVCGKSKDDPEVCQASQEIMGTGIVPQILAKQNKGGFWEEAENLYAKAKYKGTVWQLIILAELGADRNDERIQAACEFVLQMSQDRASGGFAYRGSAKGGGFPSGVLPCLTGNMIWSLIKLGYADDPRVKRGVEWISTFQRVDDGEGEKPTGWPYDKRNVCWGSHTCHLGVVKAMKAVAEIPEEKRDEKVKGIIDKGSEYLLRHHLFKRSHDLERVAKAKWLKLGFPSMWDTDVLEMLLILTKLGIKDERMQEGIELVLSKQDQSGRWILENTYNGRFQVNIERKNKSSKWITLNALRVLKKNFYLA